MDFHIEMAFLNALVATCNVLKNIAILSPTENVKTRKLVNW